MLNWRIGAAIVFVAGTACGFEARAQVDEAAAQVLKDSAAAIEKVQGVSYKSQLYGVGALKDIMDGEGEVTQLRVANYTGKKQPVWIKGAVKELGKGKTPFTVATYTDAAINTEIVEWIDDPSNTHFKRAATDRNDAQRVLSLGSQILLTEFAEAAPFSKQLKAPKIESKPNEQVRGVDCQVIMVSWEGGLRSELWWIGAQDHLPRKIEMAHGQNRDLAKGTEIWDLKTLDKAEIADIALKTPPGYKTDFNVAATPVPQPKVVPNTQPAPTPPPIVGLTPGTAAPEFELNKADGGTVSLSKIKGKVTVLTFGGSRFPKTAAMNNLVGEILDAHKDQVQAYTLACREESDQAAIEAAKQANLKFPLLLGADSIKGDYKVAGFPFTYVLLPDGRVSKAFQGPVSKQALEEAVEKALKGEVAEIPQAAPATPTPNALKPTPAPSGTTVVPNLSPTQQK